MKWINSTIFALVSRKSNTTILFGPWLQFHAHPRWPSVNQKMASPVTNLARKLGQSCGFYNNNFKCLRLRSIYKLYVRGMRAHRHTLLYINRYPCNALSPAGRVSHSGLNAAPSLASFLANFLSCLEWDWPCRLLYKHYDPIPRSLHSVCHCRTLFETTCRKFEQKMKKERKSIYVITSS